jgi:cell division protein FtsN
MSCSLVDESGKKATTSSHIITPSHYYTTAKAKNLSDRYKETLERLVVSIVRNPKTGRLQFSNNIVSTGGIGFFTHSASKSPDERYLEVVLGVPEVFDESVDFSIKVDRLFSEYGGELLSILCSETAIYKDSDVSGYGLNLSWRSTARSGTGPRITLERAVVYFSKEDASRFLNRQTSKEATLSGATVFAIQGDGRASRIAFRPLQPGEQLAASAPENKAAEKPSEELKSMLGPQVKEKDLPSKEAATTPTREPDRPKAATPAKSARETITKPAPSRPESQKLVKEIDSYPEKKVEKQPAPTVGQEPAKQKRAASPSQNDQQVASLPSQPKPQEKTPAGPKSELASRPETTPQKKEKGGEPQALAPRPGSTNTPSRAEKVERSPVPSKVERKVAERDQPLEKTAEKQSDSKPAPRADQQTKVFQEKGTSGQLAKEPVKEPAQEPIKSKVKPGPELKTEVKSPPNVDQQGKTSQQQSTSGQLIKQPLKKPLQESVKAEGKPATDPKTEAKPLPQADEKTTAVQRRIPFEQVAIDPVKRPAQGPIKTEAKPSPELKTEVKAQPEEPGKMQGVPVFPTQTKREKEEKISNRQTARENNESLALAKKKYGLDQGAEGYVIQIIFPQKAEAESWSGILNNQGYRVSMTSVGREETVRLRVGAFPSPEQAKNHLQQLEKQGLKNGVVLQVIQ